MVRFFAFVLWLLAASSIAQTSMGPVVELDPLPLRTPVGISASTMNGTTLVMWNSSGPFPFSMYWTLIDADGGVGKPPGMGAVGEFTARAPRVAAASDAGLWLLTWADNGSNGATAGVRMTANGTSLDGYAAQLASTTYTSDVRVTWARGVWWVMESRGGPTGLFKVTPSRVATMPVSLPEITTVASDIASTDDVVATAWISDGGSPTVELDFPDGGKSRNVFGAPADAVELAAGGGVVLFVWSHPAAGMFMYRKATDGSVIDLNPIAVPSTAPRRPSANFDGREFLVAWEAAFAGLQEIRLTRLPLSGSWSGAYDGIQQGAVSGVEVSGARPGKTLVMWGQSDGGGPRPQMRWVTFFDDAGVADAGTPDAGTPDAGPLDAGPLDAGPPDAGPLDAGSADAGPLDGGAPDAGAADAGAAVDGGPPDGGAATADSGSPDAGPGPRAFGIGCSTAPGSLATWALLAALLSLSSTSRRAGRSRRASERGSRAADSPAPTTRLSLRAARSGSPRSSRG